MAAALAALLCASHRPISKDAEVSLRAAQQWLLTGSPSVPTDELDDELLVIAPDGRRYAKYPPLSLLGALPAAWLIEALRELPLAPGLLALAVVPAAWTALLALALALLLARLAVPWRRAMLLAGWVVIGTPLCIYGRLYYGEISQAALLACTLLCAHEALQRPRFALLAGLAAGLAFAAKPTLLVVVLLTAAALPLPRLPRYALGALPGVLLCAGYNWLRTGSVLSFGYATGRDAALGFRTPLLVGLFGNLLSPGKSVFLYAPLLLLAPLGARALVRRAPRFWLSAWAAPLVGLTLLVSKWWAWSGDLAWGPRLLVPLLPLAALPALLLASADAKLMRVLLALTLLGALVQLPTLLISEEAYDNQLWISTRPAMAALGLADKPVADDSILVHYVPWMSPVVGQWWLLLAKLRGVEQAGPPPWSSDGFERLLPPAALPPWNLWFDGSLPAWLCLLTLLLGLAGTLGWLRRASARQ